MSGSIIFSASIHLKSCVLRVARVRSWTNAVAAMIASPGSSWFLPKFYRITDNLGDKGYIGRFSEEFFEDGLSVE